MGMLIKERIRFLKGDVNSKMFAFSMAIFVGFAVFFLPFCFDLGAKSYICKKSTHFKDKLTINRNSRLPFHSLIFLQWLQ